MINYREESRCLCEMVVWNDLKIICLAEHINKTVEETFDILSDAYDDACCNDAVIYEPDGFGFKTNFCEVTPTEKEVKNDKYDYRIDIRLYQNSSVV